MLLFLPEDLETGFLNFLAPLVEPRRFVFFAPDLLPRDACEERRTVPFFAPAALRVALLAVFALRIPFLPAALLREVLFRETDLRLVDFDALRRIRGLSLPVCEVIMLIKSFQSLW